MIGDDEFKQIDYKLDDPHTKTSTMINARMHRGCTYAFLAYEQALFDHSKKYSAYNTQNKDPETASYFETNFQRAQTIETSFFRKWRDDGEDRKPANEVIKQEAKNPQELFEILTDDLNLALRSAVAGMAINNTLTDELKRNEVNEKFTHLLQTRTVNSQGIDKGQTPTER